MGGLQVCVTHTLLNRKFQRSTIGIAPWLIRPEGGVRREERKSASLTLDSIANSNSTLSVALPSSDVRLKLGLE
eukprot:127646-Rhodomonas_salina.5